jgi:hypothetical protein
MIPGLAFPGHCSPATLPFLQQCPLRLTQRLWHLPRFQLPGSQLKAKGGGRCPCQIKNPQRKPATRVVALPAG